MQTGSGIYVIYGMRSNGKTYAVKQFIIDQLKDALASGSKNGRFMYVRRKHTHIVRTKMRKLFEDISDQAENELNSPIFFSSEKQFFIETEKGQETVGYVGSVEDAFDLKGIPFNDVNTIFFDEFLDYEYFEDEKEKFIHLLSTITRRREDVTIFMVANTVAKASPYFELLKINPNKIKPGDIAVIEHRAGARIVVERTSAPGENHASLEQKKNKYIGFDESEAVRMVLLGEWEYKNANITKVDGVGWDHMRHLIPVYVTGMGKVYELSINTDEKLPIGFARELQTNGLKVSKKIRYNLKMADGVELVNSYGVVPSLSHVSEKMIDEDTYVALEWFVECLTCGRVVFDSLETGTNFETFKNYF